MTTPDTVTAQPPCPNCGAIHLGQKFDDCPLLHAKPCSVCGKDTCYCCSDCMIERGEKIFVCINSKCRDAHEHAHPEHPVRIEVQNLWHDRCPHDRYGSIKQFACPRCVQDLLDRALKGAKS